MQPVNQAFAEEPEAPPEPVSVAADVREQEEPPAEDIAPPPEEVAAPEPSVPEPPAETVEEAVPPESPTDATTDEPESPPEGEPSDTDTDSEGVEEEATEQTVDGQETERQKTKDGEVLKIESLVTEENYYQFSKQSCIDVGRGVYHCTSNADDVQNTDSVVYSDRDDGGDMEIFLKTSRGKVKQLTDNDFDDLSPHYDPGAMKVVWQRLIDGRYQIMLYDIMEDKEVQMTYSKTNNMEPKVSSAGIVWQAWDDHDWEIMLFDGTYTEQITDNDVQDVAPVTQDGYILWNVLGGTEQQARVYSLDTKETVTIEGHEGGSIVNPRFVLVYDTEYENGDVVTQTFDPATGLSEPVAATPAPAPVDIPGSDPTGEIRALIQGKAQKDEKEFKDLTSTSTVDSPNATTTTISHPGDLTLSASSPDAILPNATLETGNIELTEYDLVIPEHALSDALNASESTQ